MDQITADFPVDRVEVEDVGYEIERPETDVTIDLTQPGEEPRLEDPVAMKERGALKIAGKLLTVFGHSLLWPFIGGIVLIITASLRDDPKVAIEILNKGYLPLLERIGDLALRVFGPLLGFVLGYYFGARGTTNEIRNT